MADNYTLVRSVLGNEVYRNNRTGKEYLIKWTKRGSPKWMLLKIKKK